MRVSARAAFTVQEAYHSKRPSWSVEAEDNSGESSIQANPNKSKAKLLGFPWIPLAELGLLNGLRAKK
jgi:hypothetical protein